MSDLWLIHYERAFEEFDTDRQTFGDADAVTELSRKLRRLGFDQHEISDQIAGAMA